MPQFRLPWKTRPQVTADVEDELRYHLDMVAARLRAEGWPEADAAPKRSGVSAISKPPAPIAAPSCFGVNGRNDA